MCMYFFDSSNKYYRLLLIFVSFKTERKTLLFELMIYGNRNSMEVQKLSHILAVKVAFGENFIADYFKVVTEKSNYDFSR